MSLHLLARPHHPAVPASGMVWKMLFDRQQALLHRWASPAFSSALAELGLRRDTLPNLTQISHLVRQRTGWTLLLTAAPVSETSYYAALRRRELPVVSRLRSFSEFDQPPGGPDLFADLFGRVPLLLEPGYATALQALGAAWSWLPRRRRWRCCGALPAPRLSGACWPRRRAGGHSSMVPSCLPRPATCTRPPLPMPPPTSRWPTPCAA